MKLFSFLFKKKYALVSIRSNGHFVRATIDRIRNGKLSTILSFDNEQEAIDKYAELTA